MKVQSRASFATFWRRGQAVEPASREHEYKTAARAMLAARQALSTVIPVHFLHDPSLSMLLTLFLSDGPTPLAQALEVTTVPPPTAQRWIEALESSDFVLTSSNDDGQNLCRLTENGREAVERAIAAVIESQKGLHVRDLH